MKINETLQKPLSIASLIRKIHNELADSQRQREDEGEKPLFEVESLTIEAHFVVAETIEGKGGFDLKIISLNGSDNMKIEQMHKITLKLKPVLNEESELGLGLTKLEISTSGLRPRPVEDHMNHE